MGPFANRADPDPCGMVQRAHDLDLADEVLDFLLRIGRAGQRFEKNWQTGLRQRTKKDKNENDLGMEFLYGF